MRLNYLLTGLIFGLVGGFITGLISTEVIVDYLKDNIGYLISICAVLFFLAVFGLLFYERIIDRLTNTTNASLNSWAEEASEFVSAFTLAPMEQRDRITNFVRQGVAIYLSWKTRALIFRTLIAVALVFAGTFATFVLIEQNSLIQQQNDAVKVQLMLADSSRKDRHGQQVANILLDISDETESYNSNAQTIYNNATLENPEAYRLSRLEDLRNKFNSQFLLSNRLTLTIMSLLNQLKPYPVFDASKLVVDKDIEVGDLRGEYLSPEKGAILKSLLSNRVTQLVGSNIDFSYSDLRQFVLPISPNFEESIKLDAHVNENFLECFQNESTLFNVNLHDANLSDSFLSNIHFPDLGKTLVNRTMFYNSSLSLPFRRSETNGKPATVVIAESEVEFRGDQSLQGVVLAGSYASEFDDSCFRMSYYPKKLSAVNRATPKVNFAGSRMLLAFDKARLKGNRKKQLFEELSRFVLEKNEPHTFQSVFSAIAQISFSTTADKSQEIFDALYETNSDITVTVDNLDLTSSELQILNSEMFFTESTVIFDIVFSSP